MLNISITIETDNAAFEPPAREVLRILSNVAHEVAISVEEYRSEYGSTEDYSDNGVEQDINGNTVATWEIVEDG